MAKLCARGRNWLQVYNSDGDVRECSWTSDGFIGNLCENTLAEIYHSDRAEKIRGRLLRQDYSKCLTDGCPYLMTGEIEDFQAELGELPEYPEEIYMAFENVCNYRCKSCTVCNMDKGKSREGIEKNYDIIVGRLKEALPYAKVVGANGMGELFASRRTLKLLSEWEPISPAGECKVRLETNGSMFDEKHWKQIENLGKYYIKAAITIMSFDEPTYQRLSGVQYPIKRIENNLRFVKSLREEGVIDELELATVVQAENFREMPEFAHRCIEEFGADYVRLRPYDNWGAQDEVEAFFMDIRNPRHPWRKDYKEVMGHPYLSDPKVHDQSGGQDTFKNRAVPNEFSDLKWKILTYILENADAIVDSVSGMGDLVLYGMGSLTTVLAREMAARGIHPAGIIDAYKPSGAFEGIPVYNIEEAGTRLEGNGKLSILVTPVDGLEGIKASLLGHGVRGDIIPIWEVVQIEGQDRLKYLNRQ